MRTLATKPCGWDAAVAAAILLLAGALALLLFLARCCTNFRSMSIPNW